MNMLGAPKYTVNIHTTELSWARPDEAPAVSRLEAWLLQALSAGRVASHSPCSASAEIYKIDQITIRGFAKLHVLNALMRQLLIFIFKYLSGILLSVDNVLHISF
jgi:hypothetical protein